MEDEKEYVKDGDIISVVEMKEVQSVVGSHDLMVQEKSDIEACIADHAGYMARRLANLQARLAELNSILEQVSE